MVDINELAKGKDTASGHIVAYRILGPTEDHAETGLYYVVLTLDTNQRMYMNSTLEYVHAIMQRKDRTATFVGDFLNDEKMQMGCDAVVFWDEERPV